MEVEVLVAFAGLSYGSHTVGFTPPATLSRAAISHYNTPALHVHGGSSHAVAVSNPSTPRSGRSATKGPQTSIARSFTRATRCLMGAILRQMFNVIYNSSRRSRHTVWQLIIRILWEY